MQDRDLCAARSAIEKAYVVKEAARWTFPSVAVSIADYACSMEHVFLSIFDQNDDHIRLNQ